MLRRNSQHIHSSFRHDWHFTHTIGSSLAVILSLLPGAVWSPPGQSPWVASQVGAVIAIGCRGRTWLQEGHRLEHPHSPLPAPVGTELEMKFSGWDSGSKRSQLQEGGPLGWVPYVACLSLLTIIAPFPTLQASFPVFSFAATSLHSLVRSSVLAPPHAMAL